MLTIFSNSTGKDNRTIIWDLCTLLPIADVPNDAVDHYGHGDHSISDTSASTIYGAAGAQQRRYHVQWSPLKRGVIATCSFDRKVQAHSVNGLVTKSGRPPKWLKPCSGVRCGFGGSVLSFGTKDMLVKLSTVVEIPDLVAASLALEEAASTDTSEFCDHMMKTLTDPVEKEIWSFMQVIFQPNARAGLLEHLGFHPDVIHQSATMFSETPLESSTSAHPAKMSPSAERKVQDALVVGNFEAAVECCLRTGNFADALILASCGGVELWQKTQERYFTSETSKKPFLGIVSAVMSNEFDVLVENSSNWKETLAIICTYAKAEDFPLLCLKLGEKLESTNDMRRASLCFMCSLNLERTVKFWKSQLEKKGVDNILALHEFCRKTSIFMRATSGELLSPDICALFDNYASALASQGLLVTASKYVQSSLELKDRLYRSRQSVFCLSAMGNQPPEFPYSMVNVEKAPPDSISQQNGSNAYSTYSNGQSHRANSKFSSQSYTDTHSSQTVSAMVKNLSCTNDKLTLCRVLWEGMTYHQVGFNS
jgi:protein transport protein SEC31